jgi:hypothetical protein
VASSTFGPGWTEPGFPDGDEADPELERNGRREHEAPSLDACDLVDLHLPERRGDARCRSPEETRVRE